MKGRANRWFIVAAVAICAPTITTAQTVPSIDTEDATLETQRVSSSGPIHPSVGVDICNGDFARGNDDDDAGSGNRVYGNAGLGVPKLFTVGATRWSARAQILALIRDDRLRLLSGPEGKTGTIVPLGTLGVSFAY